MIKIAIITNIPAPYRVPVFNELALDKDLDVTVCYCSALENNRKWNYGVIDHKYIFLKERVIQRGDKYIHNNIDVISYLAKINPDVVITTGFNPTHLYAFFYALLKGKKHIPMCDNTLKSEAILTWKHRLVRRFVYSYSHAFIGASDGSRDLYRSYNVDAASLYKSHLAVNNEAYFSRSSLANKNYDLVFSGRFSEGKCPLFVVKVVKKLSVLLNRDVSILFLGSGPLADQMKKEMENYPLTKYKFQGFVSQEELPALYCSARILVFPTIQEAWGVVANEACAAGLPVITTPAAGVAGELVRDGVNGYVCELDENLWCERLTLLLTDTKLYDEFSANSIEMVSEYSFKNSASGILDAAKHSVGK